MEKKSIGLGTILLCVGAVLATGGWIYIAWFISEVSDLVRNESLFGALLWWAAFLFSFKGSSSKFEDEKSANCTEVAENIEPPKKNAVL